MRNSAEKLYSKTDLAEYFTIPESTIRFYCERFAPYLEHVGHGRKRRYNVSCLQIIEFIRDNMSTLRTSREMESALAARFPVVAQIPAKAPRERAVKSADNAALRLLERQTRALEQIADNLAKLNLANPNQGQAAEADLAELHAQIHDLRCLVKTTEKTQQEDMEQVRGLIMRLARGQ